MGIRYIEFQGSVVASPSKFELFKKTSCFHDSEVKIVKMPGMQSVMGRQQIWKLIVRNVWKYGDLERESMQLRWM